MQQQYSAVDGQSILDICLNTYGNLDQLSRLLQDNGFGSVNNNPYSRQAFSFDNDFIDNQVISGARMATLLSPVKGPEGSQVLALIAQRYATSTAAVQGGSQITTSNNMYMDTKPDSYTAGTDGETAISLTSWIGWDILYVEKEIQPVKKTGYTWNKSSGLFTLLSTSMAQNETIFFLFQKLVTP